MKNSVILRLYTKPGCPLCDEARDVIEEAAREASFEWEEANILGNPSLYERYGHAVPVGEIDGVEVFRYRTSIEEIVRSVERQHREG